MSATQKQLGIAALQTLVICIAVIAFFSFTDFLKGSDGGRGPSSAAPAIIQGYEEYMETTLNRMWDNMDEDERDGWGDKDSFFVNYWYEYYDEHFDRYLDMFYGSMVNKGDMTYASNKAVRFGCDGFAYSSRMWGNDRIKSGGSGVIYEINLDENDKFFNGYVITNYHVIARSFSEGSLYVADTIYIRLYGLYQYDNDNPNDQNDWGVLLPVNLIGGCPIYDVAVLEIVGDVELPTRRVPSDSNSAVINQGLSGSEYDTVGSVFDMMIEGNAVSSVLKGNTLKDDENHIFNRAVDPKSALYRTPVVGTPVVAVGNALGYGTSVIQGIVSVQSEVIELLALDSNTTRVRSRVMRIDGPINNGNSGGGLFDSHGNMVGLIQSQATWHSNNWVEGIKYVLPLDVVLRVTEQVIYKHVNQVGGEYGYVNYYKDKVDDGTYQYYNFTGQGTLKFISEASLFAEIRSINPKVVYQNNEIIMSETVQIKRMVDGVLSGWQTVNKLTVWSGGVKFAEYDITRAHQVREIVIEAGYAGRTITIN